MVQIDPHQQRKFAVSVVERLREAGFIAYWAGGCVRDQLLGLTPKDYDVATDAQPDQIREVFGRRRTIPVGAAFGVITVLGPKEAGSVEVATFRQDLGYSDGRRPDEVAFSTPELDAQRRDFTINGLFYDPHEDRVIDYVGGQRDLKARIVRAIGDPVERIREDKLRMLRAVRFAATFRFELEGATLWAVRRMADQIHIVSQERIGGEMRRMLTHETQARAAVMLHDTGLLKELLPEVARLADDQDDPHPWEETLRVLSDLGHTTLPVGLAALLHMAGGPELAHELGERWRLTNKETERTAWLLAHLNEIARAESLAWPQLQRLLIAPGIEELLTLYEAKSYPGDTTLPYCRKKLQLPLEQLNPPPLLGGHDLIEHGIKPGPQFRTLLEQVRDAQLEQEIDTREEALALVDRLRAEEESSG